MSIGRNIRRLREEKDMSQGALAEKVGITQSMIAQIESNIKTPSLPVGILIAKELGVTVEELDKN